MDANDMEKERVLVWLLLVNPKREARWVILREVRGPVRERKYL